jgi:hypothetical protein
MNERKPVMQETEHPQHPTNDDIALLAYQLWEKNGRPAGQDVEFWLRAEQSLRSSIKPPAQAPPRVPRRPAPPRRKSTGGKMPGPKAKGGL